eukprot:4084900-Amphidinium_carterae.1
MQEDTQKRSPNSRLGRVGTCLPLRAHEAFACAVLDPLEGFCNHQATDFPEKLRHCQTVLHGLTVYLAATAIHLYGRVNNLNASDHSWACDFQGASQPTHLPAEAIGLRLSCIREEMLVTKHSSAISHCCRAACAAEKKKSIGPAAIGWTRRDGHFLHCSGSESNLPLSGVQRPL